MKCCLFNLNWDVINDIRVVLSFLSFKIFPCLILLLYKTYNILSLTIMYNAFSCLQLQTSVILHCGLGNVRVNVIQSTETQIFNKDSLTGPILIVQNQVTSPWSCQSFLIQGSSFIGSSPRLYLNLLETGIF